MELMWVCPMCGQDLRARSGWTRSAAALSRNLLEKVEDHVDFHVWQFGQEIEYGWLEEGQE